MVKMFSENQKTHGAEIFCRNSYSGIMHDHVLINCDRPPTENKAVAAKSHKYFCVFRVTE